MYLLTKSETLNDSVSASLTGVTDANQIIDGDVATAVETANREPTLNIDLGSNKTLDTNVVNTVGVKHVGALAVTQSGEWVMQLSGGGTLPVRVEGGRMVVDIAGGLEGLAVQLADTEVSLRAVGAI